MFGSNTGLYYDDQKACVDNGPGSCHISSITGIDTSAQTTYFYDKTKPPLSAWDFDTIWKEIPGMHPSLK